MQVKGTPKWLTRRVGWKDVLMPNAYPSEFRRDVVTVAMNREPGVTLEKLLLILGFTRSRCRPG